MADHDEPDAVDLASAYLDNEVTADERARVEADPVLLAHVERLRQLRTVIADVAPVSPASRDAAVAAALAAFDELDDGSAPPVQPSAPANVVPLDGRRRVRLMRALTTVAAAAVVVLGGLVIANRGDDDDATTANQPRPATATALSQTGASNAPPSTATLEATPSTVPAMVGTATTSATADMAASDLAADDTAASDTAASDMAAADEAPPEPAAAAPAAPAPTTTAGGNELSEAPGERPVLADADQLVDFVESLDERPPALDDVLAACRAGELDDKADAVVVNDDATLADIVVASTSNGPVAVLVGDCTVALRAPSDPADTDS